MRLLRAVVIALLAPLLLGADALSATRVTAQAVRPTYLAATASFTPATAATDVFTVSGSSTKTVRVLRVVLSGVQTTAGTLDTIAVIKRSAADTAGTAVAATRVPVDSAFAAATSTVQHYTANPTALGAAVGTVVQPRVLLGAAATVATTNGEAAVLDWDFQGLWGAPIVLRGTAEVLAINMGGGTLPTGAASFKVNLMWTEE